MKAYQKGMEGDKDNSCLVAVVESVVVVERAKEIESREEEVMALAAPGDCEIENGAAGGVARHAAAEEVKVDPVETKKEEAKKDVVTRNIIMLERPRF